jgi:type VI secretion system protein ImpE
MDAQQLFKAGKLTEAIPALNAHLRDNPSDVRSRTFLFELLCFAGEFDRAEKQLLIIQEESSKDSMLGALLYRAALAAERTRQKMFETESFPQQTVVNGTAPAPIRGILNGKPFQSLSDADPRIGEKLEVFAAGDYLWISFADIASIQIETPKKLRDLLWAPAKVIAGPALRSRELGEVLLPVISPLSFQHPDDDVRLGRATEWCADENGDEAPYGLKNLLVDGEEIPFLEIRTLEIEPASQSQPASV